MCTPQVTAREMPGVRTNALAVAAFVLSLTGMYGSPAVSGILAVFALRQARHRDQNGFALALAAAAVSVAFTALHVAMWIHSGQASFELFTPTHW
ncbi:MULTISPECIES: hypothetical protein [unclassified Mycobacterium]|uniref:hypothetical protein n=1 Tax=unclassified Mycobacterium TaxID=2642494 RepID=UPI0008011B3C|nr:MULTISPECIES: hypothetical protein [unclassified Mycobacterium]OBH03318.1 hypothetical protein A5696_07560 [Mycobacterium sp. E2699]OBI54962.1 hypothetical protein A5705_24680 [Mycobacterium sp. E787]